MGKSYTNHHNNMPKYWETQCAGIKQKPTNAAPEMSIQNSWAKPTAISRIPKTQQWAPDSARARSKAKNAQVTLAFPKAPSEEAALEEKFSSSNNTVSKPLK